jgi:hypothetical protein
MATAVVCASCLTVLVECILEHYALEQRLNIDARTASAF